MSKTLAHTIGLLALISSIGLVTFILVFGIPFLSTYASGWVLSMAGCSSPTFDRQGVCPEGSFAEPFIPLSHWMTSGAAPLILLQNFGLMLLSWLLLSLLLWLIYLVLLAKTTQDKC
jgi:hypothetical protein